MFEINLPHHEAGEAHTVKKPAMAHSKQSIGRSTDRGELTHQKGPETPKAKATLDDCSSVAAQVHCPGVIAHTHPFVADSAVLNVVSRIDDFDD